MERMPGEGLQPTVEEYLTWIRPYQDSKRRETGDARGSARPAEPPTLDEAVAQARQHATAEEQSRLSGAIWQQAWTSLMSKAAPAHLSDTLPSELTDVQELLRDFLNRALEIGLSLPTITVYSRRAQGRIADDAYRSSLGLKPKRTGVTGKQRQMDYWPAVYERYSREMGGIIVKSCAVYPDGRISLHPLPARQISAAEVWWAIAQLRVIANNKVPEQIRPPAHRQSVLRESLATIIVGGEPAS